MLLGKVRMKESRPERKEREINIYICIYIYIYIIYLYIHRGQRVKGDQKNPRKLTHHQNHTSSWSKEGLFPQHGFLLRRTLWKFLLGVSHARKKEKIKKKKEKTRRKKERKKETKKERKKEKEKMTTTTKTTHFALASSSSATALGLWRN